MNEHFEKVLRQSHEAGDYSPFIEKIPYARTLGIQILRLGDELTFYLPTKKDNIGNPVLPALHGGALAGFMELSAMLHLMVSMKSPTFPKIIDISVDYLRAGLPKDTYATCQVWRQGRRVGNVAITAWQTRSSEPVATARAHFKLD